MGGLFCKQSCHRVEGRGSLTGLPFPSRRSGGGEGWGIPHGLAIRKLKIPRLSIRGRGCKKSCEMDSLGGRLESVGLSGGRRNDTTWSGSSGLFWNAFENWPLGHLNFYVCRSGRWASRREGGWRGRATGRAGGRAGGRGRGGGRGRRERIPHGGGQLCQQNILSVHLDWHITTQTSRRTNRHTDTHIPKSKRTNWADFPLMSTTAAITTIC